MHGRGTSVGSGAQDHILSHFQGRSGACFRKGLPGMVTPLRPRPLPAWGGAAAHSGHGGPGSSHTPPPISLMVWDWGALFFRTEPLTGPELGLGAGNGERRGA